MSRHATAERAPPAATAAATAATAAAAAAAIQPSSSTAAFRRQAELGDPTYVADLTTSFIVTASQLLTALATWRRGGGSLLLRACPTLICLLNALGLGVALFAPKLHMQHRRVLPLAPPAGRVLRLVALRLAAPPYTACTPCSPPPSCWFDATPPPPPPPLPASGPP